MRTTPDFSRLPLSGPSEPRSLEAWRAQVEAETGQPFEALFHRTMEQIDVAPLYTERDYETITACNEADVTMVFAGQRLFKH